MRTSGASASSGGFSILSLLAAAAFGIVSVVGIVISHGGFFQNSTFLSLIGVLASIGCIALQLGRTREGMGATGVSALFAMFELFDQLGQAITVDGSGSGWERYGAVLIVHVALGGALLLLFATKRSEAFVPALVLSFLSLAISVWGVGECFLFRGSWYGVGRLGDAPPRAIAALCLYSVAVCSLYLARVRLSVLYRYRIPIVAGWLIGLGAFALWIVLGAAARTSTQRMTSTSAGSTADRIQARLVEVGKSMSRMSARIRYQGPDFDRAAWRDDASRYLSDSNGLQFVGLFDSSGRLLDSVRAERALPLESLVEGVRTNSEAMARLRGQGPGGGKLLALDARTLAFVERALDPDLSLVALISSPEFLTAVLTQNFVGTRFSLSIHRGTEEIYRRAVDGEIDPSPWAVSLESSIEPEGWRVEAWPSRARLALFYSPVPLLLFFSGLAFSALATLALTLTRNARDASIAAEMATVAKSRFLSNMSHEIRSPLTTLIGYTETLLVEELTRSDQVRALEVMQKNGEHLLHVINDILDLSKVESGKLELDDREFELLETLADVNMMMELRASGKGILFRLVLLFPLPKSIRGDELRLKQILINLVGNAIKFTDEGEVILQASCDVEREELEFKVVDTGVGMDGDTLGRLFDPFHQADISTTRRFGGTGLGLSISRELAVMLGGQISVESRLGIGSTFTLTLPSGPLAGKEMHLELPSEREGRSARTRMSTPRLAGRVLVVDDTVTNLDFIGFLLKKAGVDFVTASNGREAVDRAVAEKFDLLLMDMQMPVMDGHEATRLLRAKGVTTPIVAVTAGALREDINRCISNGCDAHLGKPFTRGELFGVLTRFLDPCVDAGRTVSEGLKNRIDPEFDLLLQKFVEALPGRFEDVRRAIRLDELSALADAAHRLAGAGLYGFDDLSRAAVELERAAREDRPEVLADRFERLEREYRKITGFE